MSSSEVTNPEDHVVASGEAAQQEPEAPVEASAVEPVAETEHAVTEEASPAESPEAEAPVEASAVEPVAETEHAVTEEASPAESPEAEVPVEMNASELLGAPEPAPEPVSEDDANLRALVEAVIYITEEPLTLDQIAAGLERPKEKILAVLGELNKGYARAETGLCIREVAGGYKMGTKPEHHEQIRAFVKKLKPPLKLSLAALETLAVIAYKQPVTAPEIQEVRGVQGTSVLKTLLDRKLIQPAGRKNVVGKPILYKTTKEFLVQFGLKDLNELPSLKEFEELRRLAFPDEAEPAQTEAPPQPEAEAPTEEAKPAEKAQAEEAVSDDASAGAA